LAVDIEGTLNGPDRAVDPRVFPVLGNWEAPVIVATGKAFPYPIALCEFVGIEPCVIAENGGVVFVGQTDALLYGGDPEGAEAVVAALAAREYELGWGPADLANRWRETEIAVHIDRPRGPLDDIAAEHGLEVVDTGYADPVKSPAVDKGTGLELAAEELGLLPENFLSIGDSENDAAAFEIAGEAVAVANADEMALAAADRVTDASYADGFLEAVEPYT
jgi:phosphoglycolate phosphatase (TIGR01487 family)